MGQGSETSFQEGTVENAETLGYWLRQARQLLGRTLEETARWGSSLNPSSLSKLERGETTQIRRDTLERLAPAYGPPWWPTAQSRTWLVGLVWVWTQRPPFRVGQAEADHIRQVLALSRGVVDALIQLEGRPESESLVARARALSEPLRLPGLASLPWRASWPAWAWILGSAEADIPLRDDTGKNHYNAEALRHIIRTSSDPIQVVEAGLQIAERVALEVNAEVEAWSEVAELSSVIFSRSEQFNQQPVTSSEFLKDLRVIIAGMKPAEKQEAALLLHLFARARRAARTLALAVLAQWPQSDFSAPDTPDPPWAKSPATSRASADQHPVLSREDENSGSVTLSLPLLSVALQGAFMAPHLSAILAAWASVSELPSPEAWVKELDALSWTFFSMAGWAVILRAAAMAWATTSPPVVRLLEALETYAPPPVRRPRVPVHGLPNASSWPVLAGVWQTMLLEPGDLSPWELRVTARTLAQWPVLTVWTVWDWDPNDPTDSLALETVERRLVRICEAVPQPTRQGLQLAAAVADLLAEGATGTPEGTPKRPWSVLAQWCRDQEARWLT